MAHDDGPGQVGDGAVTAAAMAGDEGAFGHLIERHRRELHMHCYRMLASYDDEEDIVQETLLRAPRQRAVLIRRDVLGWQAGETAALPSYQAAGAGSQCGRPLAYGSTLR